METIGAHLQAATWTGDGRRHRRCFTRASTTPSSFSNNFLERGSLSSSAIFMVTVAGRTSSCMAATTLKPLRRPGFSLIWCPRYVLSSPSTTLALGTRNPKRQQRVSQCLMKSRFPPSTQWKALFVAWMRARLPTITSQQTIWCKQEEISAVLSCYSSHSKFQLPFLRLCFLKLCTYMITRSCKTIKRISLHLRIQRFKPWPSLQRRSKHSKVRRERSPLTSFGRPCSKS